MTQAANLAALGSSGVNTAFKNRIINGDMRVDQRNSGASIAPTANAFTLDRWNINDAGTGVFSVQQNAGSVTPPAGFTNYLGVTSLAATTVTAGLNYCLRHQIEGYNIADFGWGTSNAKTVTLSFWVRSSLTGQFGGSFENEATNRSYPFNYTINSANTWQQISVVVPGDTNGTWQTGNLCGLRVWFGLGTGSNFAGPAGTWAGADYRGATSSVNVVSTSGATFYITGVQLEVGTAATNFDFRSYGTELQLCQRYFEVYVSGGNNTGIMTMVTGSSITGRGVYTQKVQKRANPSSVTFLSGGSYLYQGAGINAVLSAISVAVSSPSAILIDATISGATAGQPANLLENSAAGTNSISISAEL